MYDLLRIMDSSNLGTTNAYFIQFPKENCKIIIQRSHIYASHRLVDQFTENFRAYNQKIKYN